MAPKTRSIQFQDAPGFRAEYRKFLAEDPKIEDRMREFYRAKSKIPPDRLPGTMRDHKLDGPLSDFKECHLAGDILLVYQHAKDVVTLCAVCKHSDLHGKAGKALGKTIGARLR